MGSETRSRDEHVAGAWIDPAAQQAEWEAQHAPVEIEAPAGATILVVEDEHLVALDLQQQLARMGHRAVIAYSGEEAVAKAAEARFDLVLMDVKLKGAMDGVDAALEIRAASDVPIVYLTAYADNATLERTRITEPYGYIVKPFHERELRAAIRMAVQRHTLDKLRHEQQQLQRFLADASARMATSLDYRAVTAGAAELLVPRYADWCLIHLRETDDAFPSYAYARPDGEECAFARGSAHVIDGVERDLRSKVLMDITDVATLREAFGEQHLDVLREIGACSLVCVPLVARDQLLGALALVAGRARPRYGAADLTFVEDFAHRLGLALDNALLYRRAEHAIRIRDDVLAIVSHDLRTPLGTILIHADLLAQRPELRKSADAIARGVQRMNRLIGDLVDASAINAGKLALEVRDHAAAELVHEAVELFRAKAEAHGLALAEVLPEPATRVACDRERILQVLSNLIGNAIKFTPRGGRIIVGAERSGGEVRFEVRDTGRGIAPDQIPHLFERFWRAQIQRDGAGLGLFISNGILAAHGRTLAVDSTVGVGSTFGFSLPGS